MKRIILCLSLLGQMMAQEDPYQQFLDFMSSQGGRILEIEFYQEQAGERFESSGTFYTYGENHYTFDAADQRLTYKQGVITTINKAEKQVILDSIIPGEVTIFDILTGNNDAVQIGQILLEKSGFRIPFTLTEWDMEGSIWVVPTSGKPRKIHLKTGKESEIRIKIISAEPAGGRNVAKIDLSDYETLDLRE